MSNDFGFGWTDIINERISNGIPKNKLENSDYPEYSIYIARTHVTDHKTGVTARGLCKIGRAKYRNNVQRGRNQGGSDFRVYSSVEVDDNRFTHEIEKYIADNYKHRKVSGPQNQTELYDFKDNEIIDLVKDIKSRFGSIIKKVNIYI